MMKFQNEAKKSSEEKTVVEKPITGKTSIPPRMPSNMPPIMPHRDLESGLDTIDPN